MPHPDKRRPVLVIVSGVPGAGKTTLASILRRRLGWPLLNKDRIKETMFDASGLGLDDLSQPESRALGVYADAVMYDVARELLRAQVSCILESNFQPDRAAPCLAALAAQANARQVHCAVPPEVSIARYRTRIETGRRHPVHLDHLEAATRAADPIPASDLRPVPLEVPLLSINTERGYHPDLDSILAFCAPGVP
jgi:predicted kinase